ncbi:uncharacterized protein LOC115625899 [Scaptodrosophila lebanonensis]|uniref:Uncharacterized protein LOC115625899 n=1 Tax=Drosophila lebanonensis TaxID=7225 RepID=A0A6J2TPE1_DROLE|nr:uncharacterized protein LOC115625899 [Scaptodrosophila lebanonensis]
MSSMTLQRARSVPEINYIKTPQNEVDEESIAPVEPFKDLENVGFKTAQLVESPDEYRWYLRIRVYFLVSLLGIIASLQFLITTYRWWPNMSRNDRSFMVLMLLLACANLALTFFGFRRVQSKSPFNWIVFGMICEGFVLLAVSLSIEEHDLTWPFILVGILVMILYTLLGLYVPKALTPQLWILIFMSMTVVVSAIIALLFGLVMHLYVPLCCILIIFGPWAMHNSQKVHWTSRTGYTRRQYLEASLKIFINFICTVSGTCLATRFTTSTIEVDACRRSVWCKRGIDF